MWLDLSAIYPVCIPVYAVIQMRSAVVFTLASFAYSHKRLYECGHICLSEYTTPLRARARFLFLQIGLNPANIYLIGFQCVMILVR